METHKTEMKMPPALATDDPVWNGVVMLVSILVFSGALLLLGVGIIYLSIR